MRPLRILTWHIHGSYLYYLTQAPTSFTSRSNPDAPRATVGARATSAGARTCTTCPPRT